ncbi:MAG: hypothetical protein MHMPM18_002520 [Marteilia pararefringens]
MVQPRLLLRVLRTKILGFYNRIYNDEDNIYKILLNLVLILINSLYMAFTLSEENLFDEFYFIFYGACLMIAIDALLIILVFMKRFDNDSLEIIFILLIIVGGFILSSMSGTYIIVFDIVVEVIFYALPLVRRFYANKSR